ncbi:MAG: hypothetical protein AAB512_05460 [Patescibacteria group bacterium]
MTNVVSRINITLPKELIVELKKTIPPRYRSAIIASALSEKIADMKRKESLKKLKGVWEKSGGVKIKTDKDLRAWRRSLWSSFESKLSNGE